MKRLFVSSLFLIFGSFLFQSFQCASPEMSGAKMAFSQKDYATAESKLKLELVNNPTNAEALLYYSRVKFLKKEYKEGTEALNEAHKLATDSKLKTEIDRDKKLRMIEGYNGSISLFQSFPITQNTKQLDTAEQLINLSIAMNPNQLSFYNVKGRILEMKKDTVGFLETYKSYNAAIKPQIDFAISKGMYIDQDSKELDDLFGMSNQNKKDTITDKDNNGKEVKTPLLTNFYIVDGKELYVYMRHNGSNFVIDGWLYNPSKNIPDQEKLTYNNLNVEPIATLAQYYYEVENFDESLKYLMDLIKIQPKNGALNQFKVQVYQRAGKSDVAMQEAKKLTDEQPRNKVYWAQYGDMLAEAKKNEEAINAYKKALEIDANYDFALRNIASVYKNKAADLQMSEKVKQDKDSKYVIKTDAYFPYLSLSADNFEKCLTTSAFKNDVAVLSELTQIYLVMDNKAKLNESVKKLEDLEFSLSAEQKQAYYLNMIKIFSTLGDADKTKKIQEKLERLK